MADADAAAGGKRRTLWDFLLLAGGEGLSKVAGFLAFAYLGRTLSPEGFGYVELAGAFGLFFAITIDFGLGTIGAREAAKDRGVVANYATWIPSARLLLALLAVPAMAILAYVIVEPNARDLVGLYALSLGFLVFNQRWLFQGIERMSVVAGAQLLRMLVFAIGVVVFVRSADGFITVGFVELAAVGVMALYFLANQLRVGVPIRLAWPVEPLRKLYREASFVGLGQAVWAFNQQTPIIMIGAFMAASEVAWFGAANRIFVSLSTFSVLYHFNLFPTWSRLLTESKEKFDDAIRSSFRLTAWVSTGVPVVMTFVAVPLCQLVFGDPFSAAGLPLAIMSWGLPITLVSGHARWSLIACGQQRHGLVAQVAGAGVTVAVGLVAIPRLGATGAAITNLVSVAVVWSVAQGYAVKHLQTMPFLLASLKPGLGAGVAIAAAYQLDDPWLAGAAAAALFVALAAVFERKLFEDVRRLARRS